MNKLVPLLLYSLCGACAAQTPTHNLMPDGSHDLYMGLGAVYRAAYEGAEHHRKVFLPAIQMQWSNGVFLAGQTLGLHLSSRPDMEYGPLLAYDAGRTSSGARQFLGDLKFTAADAVSMGSYTGPIQVQVVDPSTQPSSQITITGTTPTAPPAPAPAAAPGTIQVYLAPTPQGPHNRLDGMANIPPRLLAGGFFNYYLNSTLRLTNSLAYGSGSHSNGMTWAVDLQQCMPDFATHHAVSMSIGLNMGNRAHNVSSYGVTAHESYLSGNAPYAPGGGINNVHASVHWNWAMSNAWLLSSGINGSVLTGGAAKSPLVERRVNLGASSALAYRF